MKCQSSFHRLVFTVLAGAFAASAFGGCEPESLGPDPSLELEPSAAHESGDRILPRGHAPAILPAYALPGERKESDKADQYDDFRAANKQWYALTEMPKGTFRPMVEWEPMSQLWTTYSNGMPNDAQVAQTIVDIVKATVLTANTKVGVVVDSNTAYNTLRNQLLGAGLTNTQLNTMVHFLRKPNNSIWFMDYGPVSVVRNDGRVGFTDFRYYHQRTLDDAIPTIIGWEYSVNTFRMPSTTEGGNFMADGNGNCFTSERGIQLSGQTQAQFAQVWKDYIGCNNLVVLKDITDDGTGHIDMFFKVVDSNSFIMGEYKSPYVSDATNKARMDQNAALLGSLIGANGLPMKVWRMPMPPKSGSIPRTFINSTFVNGVNLWPIYSASNTKAAEAEALQIWQQAMPSWTHVGIISDKIATYSGAVHCITRTVPVGTMQNWIPDGSCSGGNCATSHPDSYTGQCNTAIPCDGPKWLCDSNYCGIGPSNSCAGLCGGQAPSGCYCDSQCSQYNDCCSDYQQECVCQPNCSGKQCGSNGCGGTCGTCSAGTACNATGQCVCVPNCSGKQCGSDGCGGTCGTCGVGTACNASGQCVSTCTPNCSGKQCGSNGCGGTCGTCAAGSTCNASGQCTAGSCSGACGEQSSAGCWCDSQCVQYNDCCADYQQICTCQPNCAGKQCGSNGCGGTCGTCGAGATCNASGQCVSSCIPNCTGKVCGSNGCGGSCGQCAQPIQCAVQGDFDGNDVTNISDVQCMVTATLWDLGGKIGPAPACVGANLQVADLDCNGSLSVIDINLIIVMALNGAYPSEVDSNSDGCPNSCEEAVSCSAAGQCLYTP